MQDPVKTIRRQPTGNDSSGNYPALIPDMRPSEPCRGVESQIRAKYDTVAAAVRAWPILDFLSFFQPGLVLRGDGRYRYARCPRHDKGPGLMIDTNNNTWSCSCGHGGVVEWFARSKGWNVQAAAIELVKYSESVIIYHGDPGSDG
jgi:hypothetical protein